MMAFRATGTTTIKCGDCNRSTEYDISLMDFRKRNISSVDATEFEASADIKCSFCQSRIPYHLTARCHLPDGSVTFRCSIIGATADPLDLFKFKPQES